MSGELVVENLGKSYPQWKNERQRVLSWLFPQKYKPLQKHWSLKNVSFHVNAGETVGIVGQNGAGKSTLLKLITGTIFPTEGTIKKSGRIAAILELGMGFNPNLTGRQNAYHAAALMGYSEKDVMAVMPEIEAFAEIGDYFDQPIRVYSSGMQMRVAFSVATAFRPDLLIIDEALSVGDAYFQHKSFAKIREFQEKGTSLLLVSHDKQAIQAICNRAILLDSGQLIMQDTPETIFDYYNALLASHQKQSIEIMFNNHLGKNQVISGTGEARVIEIGFFNNQNQSISVLTVGEWIRLKIVVEIYQDLECLILGYGIKDKFGQVIFGTNTALTKQPLSKVKKGERYHFDISFFVNLGVGFFSIQTALSSSDTHLTNNYEWQDLALVFEVVNTNKDSFIGFNWLNPKIEFQLC